MYNGIHETYLYNPAYSPFLRGSTDAYEKDSNVRYFINTRDAVSMGGMGHKAPRNVVFRSEGAPISAHKLAQWQGSTSYQEPIYHAPPETRVHAHKAVYNHLKNQEAADVAIADRTEDLGNPGAAAQQILEFDFGDVPKFDYEGL